MYYYLIGDRCYWTGKRLTQGIKSEPTLFRNWRRRLKHLDIEQQDLADLKQGLLGQCKFPNPIDPIDFTSYMLQQPNRETVSS